MNDDGEDGKKEGMARVEDAADAEWKACAAQAVREAAMRLPYLTSDDVMERIPSEVTTHEHRALGPVMRNAARDGLIEKAPVAGVNCRRASRHCAPLTVWRSLLCAEVRA